MVLWLVPMCTRGTGLSWEGPVVAVVIFWEGGTTRSTEKKGVKGKEKWGEDRSERGRR